MSTPKTFATLAAAAVIATAAGAATSYTMGTAGGCAPDEMLIDNQCQVLLDGPALQAAFDQMPDGTFPQTIDLLPGHTYQISETLVIRNPIHLRGNGATIKIPLGVTAFHVLSNAGRSIFEDLNIEGMRCSGTGDTCFDPGGGGFRVEASMVTLRDIRAQAVGTGLLVLGCTGGEVACTEEEPSYGAACAVDADCVEAGRCVDSICRGRNANHMLVERFTVGRCDRAVVIHGYDASHGTYTAVSAVNCRAGILDSGFTGSNWISPHLSSISCACDGGPEDETTQDQCVRCVLEGRRYSLSLWDNTNYSTVTGGYFEGGVPPIYGRGKSTLIIGGNALGRLHPSYKGLAVGGNSRLRFAAREYRGPGPTIPYTSPEIVLPVVGGNIAALFRGQGADAPWWRWQRTGNGWELSRRTSPVVRMAGPFSED